jgi:hypothetical protein
VGRSPKPLVIACADWLFETPEMTKLANQGHKVYRYSGGGIMESVDLFIGDECWFMTKDHYHAGLLKHALERARGIKYPKDGEE